MKKLVQRIAVILMVGSLFGLVGCGNSPDGDGQKPAGGGEYGRISDLYGPAGDGRGKRSTVTN